MKLVTLSRKSLSFVRPVLFRPWFYLALGIHAGLLWLPLPSDSEQAEIPPEEEVIKITQLAASPDAESDTEGNTKATPEEETATQPSIPQANPLPPFTPPRSNPYTPFTVPTPEFDEDITFSPQTLPSPTPTPTPTPQPENTPTPSPSPSPSPISQPENTPTPSPSPSPSPTNIPENSPPSNNTPENEITPPGGLTHDGGLLGSLGNTGQDSGTSGTTAQPDDFFALFPRYPNAQQGSGGVLRNQFETAAYIYNTSDNLDLVISGLDSELQNTPFTWQKTLEDGNFKVYQVTNTETSETKYLHLVSQNEKTILYLEENDYTLAQLSEAEVRNMADRESVGVITGAAIGNGLLLELADVHTLTNSYFERFQNSENVYQPGNEIASKFEFADKIQQALRASFPDVEMTEMGEYEGAITYKVVDEGSYTYLMFVQGNEGQSVMIITPNNPLANT